MTTTTSQQVVEKPVRRIFARRVKPPPSSRVPCRACQLSATKAKRQSRLSLSLSTDATRSTMANERLTALKQAYQQKQQQQAGGSMEERSFSSVGDPFGLVRSNHAGRSGSATLNSSRSSSQVSRRNTSSVFNGKPPLQQRMTIETLATAVSQSDDDTVNLLGHPSQTSIQTTPNSNHRNSSNNINNSSNEAFPSQLGASMRPLNLSDMSPESTILSQLSSSPDLSRQQQQPQQYSLLQQQQQQQRRLTMDSTTSRFSQTLLSQLQSQLRSSQADLQKVKEDKRNMEAQFQTQLAELQVQLQERVVTHNLTAQSLAAKEDMLAQLQSQLDSRALALEQEETSQQERQHQEWQNLQRTIADLESTQMEEEARLQQWSDELQDQQKSLQDAQHDFQQQQQAHDRMLKQEMQNLDAVRQQLQTREERLEEQTLVLRNKQQALEQQEETNHTIMQEMEVERREIEMAMEELELKSSSVEAKYELVEQALQEAIQKRQDEEGKLAEAVTKRQEVMAQAEAIQRDCERVKEALEAKIRESEEEYAALQDEIDEKGTELSTIKERIKAFLVEENISQAKRIERVQEADRKVGHMLEQIEVAKREKESITKVVDELYAKHDKLVEEMHDLERQSKERYEAQIQREETKLLALRDQQEMAQNALNEALETLAQSRLRAESEAKEMLDAASQQVATAHENLNAKSEQLESLRKTLEETARKYSADCQKLQIDQAACQTLTAELNEKIASFAVSEGREKRIREELEWEVERLSSLVRTDRDASKKRIQEADDELESARQRNRDQLQSLAIRLEEVEGERDSLSQQVDGLREHLEKQITDTKSLTEELQVAASQLAERDAEIQQLKQSCSVISEERVKLDSLVKSLETHCARVEKSEAELIEAQQQLESKVLSFDTERKKDALLQIISRSFRHEKEALSASFSKWVRFTLFLVNEEDRLAAQDGSISDLALQLDGLSRANVQLEGNRANLLAEKRLLQDNQKSLRAELEGSEKTVKELRAQISTLESECIALNEKLEALAQTKTSLSAKQQMTSQTVGNGRSNSSSGDVEKRMRKLETLVSEREAELRAKEVTLHEREKALRQRENEISTEFEGANTRIMDLATLLRQKEIDLEFKETHLASELAKCKDTQSRLQNVALNIQTKAQQLTREQTVLAERMKDCDELEARLSEWQTCLEYSESNGVH
jgi:chromosome segregation ATPase